MDRHLVELGRMVGVWGSLESMTAMAIAKLAGFSPTDPRALTIVGHGPIGVDVAARGRFPFAHGFATLISASIVFRKQTRPPMWLMISTASSWLRMGLSCAR
ncbi:hypothetical protein [Paraburkholderia hospita]|uniref:hypothetical protein n=1 Tax=Paraburkholderia hospita TaxID=169430 RepID=UPI000271ADD3|nr:hypothetical protein [Paraburkholderia hospita]EUC12372.1 hypothetical protein PMI06_008755 [Burkholderia sp. BT03]SKC52310.1 hypothetical protein SAMN06266956_0497 [Paraburkholderia hospita]